MAHASVMAVERARYIRQDWLRLWFVSGQAKIILRVKDLEELLRLKNQAQGQVSR
ncbi:MAG TPA: peptidyl-tRNA hydrolase [Nitrososphaeraceae archaeon]|nr:peptidyl-tRNA hydrolase [Nitrososphaeraceae archaeon]